MRRKAQSQIITTILLILIVLAAVIVVWVIIDRFLDVPTADCTEVKLSIENVDKAADTVSVKRLAGGSNIAVNSFKVASGQEVVTGGAIEELQTLTVSFGSTDIDTGSVIEVAAVIQNSDGVDFTCPATDKLVVS
jgi:flagellin-like protein